MVHIIGNYGRGFPPTLYTCTLNLISKAFSCLEAGESMFTIYHPKIFGFAFSRSRARVHKSQSLAGCETKYTTKRVFTKHAIMQETEHVLQKLDILQYEIHQRATRD